MHFKLVFPCLDLFYAYEFSFHVYVYFCQTLRYTCIPLESFAFHANLYYGLELCLGICMYTSCLTKHTYALKYEVCFNENLVFHVFMYLCLTSCICPSSPNYSYTYTSFLSHVPSCIYFCGLVVFGYVCITLVCIRHTYALKIK